MSELSLLCAILSSDVVSARLAWRQLLAVEHSPQTVLMAAIYCRFTCPATEAVAMVLEAKDISALYELAVSRAPDAIRAARLLAETASGLELLKVYYSASQYEVNEFLAEVLCGKVYLAAVLTPESHKVLLDWAGSNFKIHGRVYAHHCTMKWEPSSKDLQAGWQGYSTTVKVTSVVNTEDIQAVGVDCESTNQYPHVTIACGEAEPIQSNEAMADAVAVDGPTLEARILWVEK